MRKSTLRAGLRRAAAVVAGAAALALTVAGCTPQTSAAAAGSEVPIVSAELDESTAADLQAAVDQAVAASGATGAVVAVWIPWAGAWVEGTGTTGPDSDDAVTADMHFRIGDVTRAMTCQLLADLDAEGVVSADDELVDLLPSVPTLEGITLQQLCDGTSGLGDGRSRLDYNFNATPERRWNPRELAATGMAERTEPGNEVRDSDAAYLLLGLALENATGETAQHLFEEYLAEPRGLESTALPAPAAATAGDPVLPGYISFRKDRENGCVAPRDFTTSSSSIGFTDSGATSTISDLARFTQSLALDAVDSDGELTGPWASALPFEGSSYANGAYIDGSMIGQKGRTLGYLTAAYADTQTGMTVAVALNNSAASADLAGALAKELAAIASKAPAAEGQAQPEFGLPWTAEEYHQVVADKAVCPLGD